MDLSRILEPETEMSRGARDNAAATGGQVGARPVSQTDAPSHRSLAPPPPPWLVSSGSAASPSSSSQTSLRRHQSPTSSAEWSDESSEAEEEEGKEEGLSSSIAQHEQQQHYYSTLYQPAPFPSTSTSIQQPGFASSSYGTISPIQATSSLTTPWNSAAATMHTSAYNPTRAAGPSIVWQPISGADEERQRYIDVASVRRGQIPAQPHAAPEPSSPQLRTSTGFTTALQQFLSSTSISGRPGYAQRRPLIRPRTSEHEVPGNVTPANINRTRFICRKHEEEYVNSEGRVISCSQECAIDGLRAIDDQILREMEGRREPRAGSHTSRRRREAEKPKKEGKNQNWVERWTTMEHDAAVHAFGSTWVHCLGCSEVVSIDDRAHFSRYGFVKHMKKCGALTDIGLDASRYPSQRTRRPNNPQLTRQRSPSSTVKRVRADKIQTIGRKDKLVKKS